MGSENFIYILFYLHSYERVLVVYIYTRMYTVYAYVRSRVVGERCEVVKKAIIVKANKIIRLIYGNVPGILSNIIQPGNIGKLFY